MKYFKFKFDNIEDHKDFEVSYLFQVASVNRDRGELTLLQPSLNDLEYWIQRIKEENERDE